VAELVAAERLTETGTLRLHFRVTDDAPFTFLPGQFVGIQAYLGELGYRRSPYCILSPPREEKTFELLVRIVPEGPLSRYLTSLQPGDVISFRGPTGRTMIPTEPDTELILLATGVGIGPFLSLLRHTLPRGFERLIRLFWGLRLAEDICLTDELEEVARRYPNVTYRLSLSQPPEGWRDLKGRLTETVPPLLQTLGGKHFYLAGNGAMIEEMSAVLSDLGVARQMVYEEHYFNFQHRPDPAFLEQLRDRFVAADLPSPRAHREALEEGLQGGRAKWLVSRGLSPVPRPEPAG
jgi:ferredoxin-NADP reductase